MSYLCKIFINNDELKSLYEEAIEKHNNQVLNKFFNSGFDLFCPMEISLNNNKVVVNTEITCAMYDVNNNPVGFYLYPRSSITKTNLILANSVGIIDNNYRGPLIGKFHNFLLEDNIIEKHSRLLQICSPTLDKFFIEIVEKLEDLEITERGSGGFGSTGI